jgi:hypothetical protein
MSAARSHRHRDARYDLSTVGPAPIPPHERQWRHPSELAPTAADIDTPTNARALILATGTTALLLAAVLVVAISPSRSAAPSAVSATTLPAATIELQRAAAEVEREVAGTQEAIRPQRNTILSENGLALVGAPNAVSAAPVGDADDFAIAGDIPAGTERVIVLTASHAYDLRWGDIGDIAAPNGSIVMTRDGSLLAMFVSGELRLLVD